MVASSAYCVTTFEWALRCELEVESAACVTLECHEGVLFLPLDRDWGDGILVPASKVQHLWQPVRF